MKWPQYILHAWDWSHEKQLVASEAAHLRHETLDVTHARVRPAAEMENVGIVEMTEEEKKEMVTEDTTEHGQTIILRETAGMTGENAVAAQTGRETKNAKRGMAEARKGVQVLSTQNIDDAAQTIRSAPSPLSVGA